MTSGGPGGATDTVSSFIYREYRDRSNVGYGTMLADGLPDPDHRLRHAAAEARQQPHAEDDLNGRRMSHRRATVGTAIGERSGATHRQRRLALRADLCRADRLGVHLAVSGLLDDHHLVQGRGGRHAGPSHPLGRFHARLEGLAQSSGCRPTRSSKPRPCATSSSKRFENSVITSVGASILAVVIGSLAAYGLSRFRYSSGPMAERGHLLLLPVAADPAAGRAGAAVPRSLQGAGAARHDRRADPALHADRCCRS